MQIFQKKKEAFVKLIFLIKIVESKFVFFFILINPENISGPPNSSKLDRTSEMNEIAKMDR